MKFSHSFSPEFSKLRQNEEDKGSNGDSGAALTADVSKQEPAVEGD